tara:strand:+ start:2857 stop:3171 length:315 start_codon:yes stop_codon:yes gene_type:complete
MNVPTLPNEIIFKILNHRKDIKYLDRKYEEQQKHKINLLNELDFQIDDMEMLLQNMFDNSHEHEEEELIAIENTAYSLLLLENINNYNYFEKSFESMVLITFED